jgi:hypothetical protein
MNKREVPFAPTPGSPICTSTTKKPLRSGATPRSQASEAECELCHQGTLKLIVARWVGPYLLESATCRACGANAFTRSDWPRKSASDAALSAGPFGPCAPATGCPPGQEQGGKS